MDRMETPKRIRTINRLSYAFTASSLLLLFIYYIPTPAYRPVVPPYVIEKPSYVGKLALNEDLDKAEKLFDGKIRGPEASAVDSIGNFYTAVEGGFIIYVDTTKDIATKVASLNSELTRYQANRSDHIDSLASLSQFNYCSEDSRLYGEKIDFSPDTISYSRCSRPTGLRLSPDESYLYVIDPMNGLFRVDLTKTMAPLTLYHVYLSVNILTNNTSKSNFKLSSPHRDYAKYANMRQVSLLIDAKKSHRSLEQTRNSHILLADDLAVDWSGGIDGEDIIYFTDATCKWTFRDYVFSLGEHDDSGRIMRFNAQRQQLNVVETVTPKYYHREDHADNSGNDDLSKSGKKSNNVAFPNGIELMDDRQALLINELGASRILKHYIRGPKEGSTEVWAPSAGWPDNIKRGADVDRETYWVASACALADGNHFDFLDYLLQQPILSRIIIKTLSLFGRIVEKFGEHIAQSKSIRDYGFAYRHIWMISSKFCRHGIVVQYDRDGNVLRSLQTSNVNSMWKSLTEAREILLPIEEKSQQTNSTALKTKRYLYLFSFLYNYLGRIELSAPSTG